MVRLFKNKGGRMKNFWLDMFYDLENTRDDWVAKNWSATIQKDLESIEDAIKNYDLIKALGIIENCKEYY